MTSEAKKLIVVIGMHRTGTSLITRGLQVMGVNLGDNLLPAMAEVNAKGFWEDADINAFNIELLHAINSEWDYLAAITDNDIQQLHVQGYFLKAVELLRNKVSQSAIFGLKDPRIAKLLPFWDQVFSHCHYDVNYLLTIRHPLSVVKSLQKRDGFIAEKAYLLWFTHVLNALIFAARKKVSLVDYDYFMEHPSSELDRLAEDFGMSINQAELQIFLDEFVDNDLRHTQYELNDLLLDKACPHIVNDIYTQLLSIAKGKAKFDLADLGNSVDVWAKNLEFGQIPFAIIDSLYVKKFAAEQELLTQSQALELKSHLIANLEKFNADRAQQVEILYAASAERDQHIEALNVQISVANEHIATANQRLSTADSEIVTLYSATQERDAHIKTLSGQLEVAGDEISKLYDATEERDAHIKNLTEQLKLTENNIKQLYIATEARDSHIATLNDDIIDLNQQLVSHQDEINRVFTETLVRDEHIRSLDQQLSVAESEVHRIYAETIERDQHIAKLDNLVNSLLLQNQTMISSRSWRMTRPIRFLGRLLRHGIVADDKQRIYRALFRIHQKSPAVIRQLNRAIYWYAIKPILGQAQITSAVMVTAHAVDEAAQVLPSSVELEKLPYAPSSGREFIVWGVIDWHFRHQRPQQIAQALAAEGDRVFYISSNLSESKEPGFLIEQLDQDGRLFQVNLCVVHASPIYHSAPSPDMLKNLLASLGELLLWAKAEHIVSLVQHPFWYPLAQQLPNSQMVYDCMDHHEGFENTGNEIIKLEHDLFKSADLTITTSGFLDDIVAKHTPRREVIRNAGEFEYFTKVPDTIYQDVQGRKIIGYYGAIAEWFDIELIRLLSQRFADCLILLVGADTVNAQAQLGAQKNIVFIGEVPYQKLTHYLYAFDVCLLPFRVIPLILATNPVKIYEYLGAGKPVVAVDVPEVKQFGNLVHVGENHDHFADQVSVVLSTAPTKNDIALRKAFAEQQTWHHRARALGQAISKPHNQPKVSVIVVTYNNLDLTKQCLNSLDKYTDYSDYEVIVVDNASSDDSPAYLRDWVKQGENRILILNPDNKGFAAGNNQGLLKATGEYLVLLNNDTHVTPGWISTLVKHMQRNPSIGLLGPVTGNIGNEAKINIQYSNMDEMLFESNKFTRRHIGQLTPLRTAAFFCVMISHEAYKKVGLLDELFGIGFFEDDDYCRRIEQAGFTIFCADDVFIHHHLSASFNKLKVEARQKLFEQNKITYEAKWGPWIPHKYRPGVG